MAPDEGRCAVTYRLDANRLPFGSLGLDFNHLHFIVVIVITMVSKAHTSRTLMQYRIRSYNSFWLLSNFSWRLIFTPVVKCQLHVCEVGYSPYLVLPGLLRHLHFCQDQLIGFNLMILFWPDLPMIVIRTLLSRLKASCSLYQRGLADHCIVLR